MPADIIYLTDTELHFYRPSATRWGTRKTLECLFVCQTPEQARQALTALTASSTRKPLRVVLDIMEESYALEALPHLTGRDRTALLQRRKNQLFPGHSLTYVCPKGRDPDGRRDDRVFFAAVGNEKMLRRWLDLLFDLQWPVAGIQSMPVLTEQWSKRLGKDTYKLLIGLNEDANGLILRQSFFKNDVLALSRLRHIKSIDDQELLATIRDEIDRTRRFLSRQFGLGDTGNIVVDLFYASDRLRQRIAEAGGLNSASSMRQHLTTDHAAALGWQLPADCGLKGLVLMSSVKPNKSAGHYQDPKSSHFFRHYQLNRLFKTASGLLVISSLVYAFNQLSTLNHDRTVMAALHQEQQALTLQMQQTPEAPVVRGFSPFDMKAQLDARAVLLQRRILPAAILTPLSEVLQHFPTIRLQSIAWGDEHQENENPVPEADPVPAEGDSQTGRRVKLKMTADFYPFDGHYRKALAMIERLSGQLQQQPRLEAVKVLKWPIELKAGNELSGASDQPGHGSEFIIEMQWLPVPSTSTEYPPGHEQQP